MIRFILLLIALAFCTRILNAGTVLTMDGALHEGELAIDHALVVRGSPLAVRLPFSGILRARFAAANPALQPGIVLLNGGRITGRFSSLMDAAVRIEGKRISIPSKEIAWAIYQPVPTGLAAQAPKGKTGALLENGDFFEGTPRGGDANTAKVLSLIFGPRTFSPGQLHALVLRDPQPLPAVFDVLTRDGSIYPALDIVADDDKGIALRHPLYNGLRIPLPDIAEIRASASRIMPLDGVRPTRVDIPPGRQAGACFAANRSLDGSALKLGTRTATAGFECATGAAVWWKPPPGAGMFFALVAAGAGVPSGQKLTFAAYADGKLAGRSTPLAAGDPPAVMRCAVPATESLVLRIEGTGGPTSNGTWAEPMLLRH
ncbi:MAG: hypothetical protein ABIP20_12520 [Chthoniobacteraceae bacterium]